MPITTVAGLLEHEDDFAEWTEKEIKELWKNFPTGVQATAMFTMNNQGDMRKHDLLANSKTKPVISTQSKWTDNGTLYIFIQYWRVPPKPEEKREDTAPTRSGFRADPASEANVEKRKQEESEAGDDIAPATHKPGDKIEAVEQDFDLGSAEKPPEVEKESDTEE